MHSKFVCQQTLSCSCFGKKFALLKGFNFPVGFSFLDFFHSWFQAVEVDVETVQVTALRVIFDLLHMFGMGAFETDQLNKKKKAEEQQTDEKSEDDPVSFLQILCGFVCV